MPRPEPPYPVADHHARISVVESRVVELHDQVLEMGNRIEASINGLREQIIRQNGRVDGLEGWRDQVRGAGKVLLFFVPVATSLLTALLMQLL